MTNVADGRAVAGASAIVSFSTKVYDLETVKKAAYRLTNLAAFDFSISDAEISCTVTVLPGKDAETVERVVNEFRNEVLDQDLRRTVARETEAARNAILAYAFSRTGLQGDDR